MNLFYDVTPGYLIDPLLTDVFIPVPPVDIRVKLLSLLVLMTGNIPLNPGIVTMLLSNRVSDMIECFFWLFHSVVFSAG